MYDRFYKIHEKDNVAIKVSDGMKYAVCDIKKGTEIIKYGFPIGVAAEDVLKGDRAHTDNIRSQLNDKKGYAGYRPFLSDAAKKEGTFLGYRRKFGTVGIRNDIFVVPLVGCVNGICEKLAKETGALALTHPYGCSQLGDDHEKTRQILRGLVLHPNAGGVLVVSLGCENNTLESFKKMLSEYNYDACRIKFMTVQNETDEIAAGLKLINELKDIASKDVRTPCRLSSLIIGLKCGGSDGLSGITANPLVGQMSDRIIACGGSAVLTEIPEMFGAEDVLLSRCKDKAIYGKLVKTIDDFKDYYKAHGEPIDENPSPGNKAGGISTLADKSLGCVQKGGTTAVVDVIDYGELVKEQGLTVLNGPGNDIVACTALAAAGAQIILFTTGRGTPLGGAVPVIKISTNTLLSEKKKNWIDFDAGRLLSENAEPDKISDSLFFLILNSAEGTPTKSEQNGFREIAIWKNGVTL